MAYFNVIGFLEDEELYKIWDICAEALERKGWDCDNAELSIRAFDDNLKPVSYTHLTLPTKRIV